MERINRWEKWRTRWATPFTVNRDDRESPTTLLPCPQYRYQHPNLLSRYVSEGPVTRLKVRSGVFGARNTAAHWLALSNVEI